MPAPRPDNADRQPRAYPQIPENSPGGFDGQLLLFAEDLREEGLAVGTSEILANSVIHREEGQAAEPTTENRAVTWGFEPGSVMKAITISALIDSGTVDVDSQFEVPMSIDVHDATYSDDHLHPTEMLTAEEIIQQKEKEIEDLKREVEKRPEEQKK